MIHLVLQAIATPFAVGVLLWEPDGMFYMLLIYYFFCKLHMIPDMYLLTFLNNSFF